MNKPWSLRNSFPVILSVALLLAAFPPLHFRLLVFVGLVPWLLQLRTLSAKGAAKSGFFFGFLYYIGQMTWLYPFVYKWTGNLLLPVIPLILVGFLGAAYFALQGWLIQRCYAARLSLMIPLVWAAMEIFRSYCPWLAFPWGLLATPLSLFPQIIQHAALGTIFLVSAWVVLVNLIFVQLIIKEKKTLTLSSSTIVFIFLIYSFIRYQHPPKTVEEKRIMLGQIGVDMAFTPIPKMHQEIHEAIDKIFTLAKKEKPDLLLLPEGLTHGGSTIPPHTSFPYLPPVPTIFGGVRGDNPYYQAAFAYSHGHWQYEDKTRLVIFGEYVPFRNDIPFLKEFKLPSGNFTPGKKIKVFPMNHMIIGPIICFEELFPDIAYKQTLMGANLLAIMSIDDFFMGTPAIDQLKDAAIWRAVESGLPLGRCGSEGVTMALDARGNILAEAPVKIFDPILISIKLPEKSDAFIYREQFSWITGIAAFWVVLGGFFKRKQKII